MQWQLNCNDHNNLHGIQDEIEKYDIDLDNQLKIVLN